VGTGTKDFWFDKQDFTSTFVVVVRISVVPIIAERKQEDNLCRGIYLIGVTENYIDRLYKQAIF
jgi:hypothetical protein